MKDKKEKKDKKRLTTASGRPYFEHEDTMSAGARGPLLLQDHLMHENLAHFNRERIPERVVHAKGSGAYGTFRVTHEIGQYTKAKLFKKEGNICKVFVRFSTVGGEKGSADTERDPRGFAVRFYTEEGNWDLVGNNTPVFFIKDPKKFPDFIHTQKRDPKTNLKSANMMWDYWSLNPESLHQVMILFSDRGTPDGYRKMNGYGSHTFSMINKEDQRIWVKFHFKTLQGNKTLTAAKAEEIKGKDPDYAQRDLITAISKGNNPRWALNIQVMTDQQAKDFRWNPFDITKVWPHSEYPLIEIGIMELNEIPANYHTDVEQAAFAPSNTINGIGLSPDKMLQGRIFAYPDAHRYRLGANYQQIPVNRPICPIHNYQRDGMMRVENNSENGPNYFPNSFDNIEAQKKYKEQSFLLDSNMADTYPRNQDDDDFYTQPGILFSKVMTETERNNTTNNIIDSMSCIEGAKREEIIQRQLSHFYKADQQLALNIAQKLDVKFKPKKKQVAQHH